MNIDGIHIGEGSPCRFVFEVSNAHNGSFERALRLIDAAKACGADFVKFQCYTPDELVALRGDGPAPEPWGSQGFTMKSLYEKAQTPLAWFPALFQHARDIGIVPFSSVFGLESLALLERCACPAYKIAALDNGARSLSEAVASRNKPMLVSRRGFGKYGWRHPDEISLYCGEGYPTPSENVHLPFFDMIHGSSYLGLSSHCLDPRLPIAAVARGCKLIEMHGMLREEPSELEVNVSLDPFQFDQMIADVRATEVLLA